MVIIESEIKLVKLN